MGAAASGDAPLVSAPTLAALQKSDPAVASAVQSAIASGKVPTSLSSAQLSAELAKVPIAERTQLIAALKAQGINISLGTTQVAAIRNPFSAKYDVKQLLANVPPVSSFISFVNVSQIKQHEAVSRVISLNGTSSIAPIDVALGRVSGIILSGGVHALYEADGQTYILQPGDSLPEGSGRIIAIDPDGIIVKISGDRYVRVEVTANDPSQNQPQSPFNGFGGTSGGSDSNN